MKTLVYLVAFLYLSLCQANDFLESAIFTNTSLQELPSTYKGRVRPLEASSRLWLYDLYNQQQIKSAQKALFHLKTGTAIELEWKLFFFGHQPWDHSPLFWIHYAELKELLALNLKQDRFSYHELSKALSNKDFLKWLMTYQYAKNFHDIHNRAFSEKQELHQLAPRLWVELKGDDLILLSKPNDGVLWRHLPIGLTIAQGIRSHLLSFEKKHRVVAEEALKLMSSLNQYSQNQGALHAEATVEQQGSLLKLLPSRYHEGLWYSLNTLKAKSFDEEKKQERLTPNFTLYSDNLFKQIQTEYELLETALKKEDRAQVFIHTDRLVQFLNEGYASIAGKPYKEAYGKTIDYPTVMQIQIERDYYHYPLTELAILFYAIALILFVLSYKKPKLIKLALACAFVAFGCQTILLVMRCFILQRPPVSNMFETVIYVPWIAMLLGFILHYFLKNHLVLVASSVGALCLLILLKLTNLNSSLDNVQAVLDSQYWLIVHVLMVVGSYGVFLLGGVLGHFYLISSMIHGKETPQMAQNAKLILQCLYMGVAMLIPGTILGGVWAAESWGRFWDWDPKESWAFISSCIYLIWIHAYTFGYIRHFGLSVGAIIGLLTISFTWYGVNYILGTGLHSYGFGSGGDYFYYLFILAELVFLGAAYRIKSKKRVYP
jgi:ABC-type transport system involved in cytochrome c biogenesis permease subunit